jgi:hypothetical protein
LLRNDKEIHIQTHRLTGGFMKNAVEMGSGAMKYITKFHKDWFRHSKVGKLGYTDTQTA